MEKKKKIRPNPKRLKEVKLIIFELNETYSEWWIEEIDHSKSPPFYGVWTTDGSYYIVSKNIGFDLSWLDEFVKSLDTEYLKTLSSTDHAILQNRQLSIKSHQPISSRKFKDTKTADRAYQAALMKVSGLEKDLGVLSKKFKVTKVQILNQFKKVK